MILRALLLLLVAGPALAGQPINCSQTVGASAAAVSFANGVPQQYVLICNAHGSNSLGVNFVGGTAAIGAAGTETLTAGQCLSINRPSVPLALSVIGSGAGTTTACGYQ